MSHQPEFRVSKREILHRGIRHRCPNCGEKTLFTRGLTLNHACANCGMVFDRDEGFFLGSMTVNYALTALIILPPILILAFSPTVPGWVTLVVAVIGSFAVPILLYRLSRSWWLMAYFYFLPQELPANRDGVSPHEDDA